jgi:signal transduction histidine kinase
MDVIKKLQIKFIITVVLILTFVFTLIVVGINTFNRQKTEGMYEYFLDQLITYDGFMPNRRKVLNMEFAPRTVQDEKRFFSEPFEYQNIRNYFSVKVSNTGEIISIISDFPLHYTEIEIGNLVKAVFASNNFDSTYEGMRYKIAEKHYGYLAVFTETRAESNMQSRLYGISFVIFAISLVFSIFIAWLLSIWAVKPVRQSFEKQRRFVGDASHELKTPLSVISTNMDVLVSEIGENKWTEYIQHEIVRMSNLVKDLLYLAKSDDGKDNYQMTEFDLSRCVMSVALPFESIIFDSGKSFNINIQENLFIFGISQRIEQLVAILLDNALKYSNDGGEIRLELKSIGSKKVISVYNSGEGIPEESQKAIFERFYRLDSSRNRETGGFGLGLSIAKNIVDLHKGKIQLNSEVGKFTEFVVTL